MINDQIEEELRRETDSLMRKFGWTEEQEKAFWAVVDNYPIQHGSFSLLREKWVDGMKMALESFAHYFVMVPPMLGSHLLRHDICNLHALIDQFDRQVRAQIEKSEGN